MSGLFQRIARRRAGESDETSAPNAADHVGADAPAQGADPAAEAPTRYIGAPAPESPADGPSPVPPEVAAQSTELFAPVEEQPTVAQPPVSEQPAQADATPSWMTPGPAGGSALSAAAAGAAPQSVGDAEAAGVTPAAGEPAPVAPGDATGGVVPGDAAGGAGPADATGGAASEGAASEAANGDATTGEAAAAPTPERKPGFRERGRMRRRLRYLRRVRELQVRDLGGLAFDLRRFERKRDDLVAQKIDQIRACDDELRSLEETLAERRDIRDVRAPGIGGTCPRCFSLYGSNDRFCAHCGAALGGLAQGPAQVAAPPPQPAPAAPAAPAPPAAQAPAAPAAPPAPPAGAPHEPTPPQ
ncbi:hypothetical protein [Conexibacter woesei]|uniref:Zinc ribbon domain-containing protein n=1 Tax=Conexibacter woesei (strain DSM 14684 / CCUG 47730 / CIP 108061 / JCM 11494 / NBRC 100937 / ID131577) TaxID=469383 RepID=D3F2B3_CONWI|nr:hypothetical protein [Conexibacter woesei]ADB50288.1 hypothetical protein Cwoe_1862 [Conexibacter woesei DSM 14684]